MKVGKWNYKTRDYDDYTLPHGACLWSNNMEKWIKCACCAKDIKVGDCFTSFEIQGIFGFGFFVCPDCYEQEIERRNKGKRK